MAKRSAGLLMFRGAGEALEVLLVHPGGPFWRRKDLGAWSLPKGEFPDDEDPLTAARREFREEVGVSPEGQFMSLGEIRQPGGKIVVAWAVQGSLDTSAVRSNTFEIEWPPGSGKLQEFPEVDRAEWFLIPAARQKILKGQLGFLARLETALTK